MRILAVAPRHLGDGVMALPALAALARLGDLVIRAPGWGATLYRDLPARLGDATDADLAVVFPPSIRAAWSVRGVPRRIGVGPVARGASGVPYADLFLRRGLLTDTVPEAPHRGETYARLARAVGGAVEGAPVWRARDEDPATDVPSAHIGLNPVAQGGGTRTWSGWTGLAARLAERGDQVVFYAGPGESLARWSGGTTREGLSLAAFGRALSRCRVFVSSDTGPAHFARACGVPTVVIYGSTTHARTGPAGATAVEGPDPGCRPCYAHRCAIGVACLEIPVDDVLRAMP